MVLAFYVVLFGAGGDDIWAQRLGVAITPVRNSFRIALFVIPPLIGLFTAKVCRDLRAALPLAEASERGRPPVGPVEDQAVDHLPDDDGSHGDSHPGRAAEAAAVAAAATGVAAGALGYRWGRRRPKVIRIEREAE